MENLTKVEKEFIKRMETRNSYEFRVKKNGTLGFKKWDDFNLVNNYFNFNQVECTYCKKPYFKRKYQQTKVHGACQVEIVNLKKREMYEQSTN